MFSFSGTQPKLKQQVPIPVPPQAAQFLQTTDIPDEMSELNASNFIAGSIHNALLQKTKGHDRKPDYLSEGLNTKAIAVINRVRDKLTGSDFNPLKPLDVIPQVDGLVEQATSHENLCQCYIGWCPFW